MDVNKLSLRKNGAMAVAVGDGGLGVLQWERV